MTPLRIGFAPSLRLCVVSPGGTIEPDDEAPCEPPHAAKSAPLRHAPTKMCECFMISRRHLAYDFGLTVTAMGSRLRTAPEYTALVGKNGARPRECRRG